jgi:hypothetical protein
MTGEALIFPRHTDSAPEVGEATEKLLDFLGQDPAGYHGVLTQTDFVDAVSPTDSTTIEDVVAANPSLVKPGTAQSLAIALVDAFEATDNGANLAFSEDVYDRAEGDLATQALLARMQNKNLSLKIQETARKAIALRYLGFVCLALDTEQSDATLVAVNE